MARVVDFRSASKGTPKWPWVISLQDHDVEPEGVAADSFSADEAGCTYGPAVKAEVVDMEPARGVGHHTPICHAPHTIFEPFGRHVRPVSLPSDAQNDSDVATPEVLAPEVTAESIGYVPCADGCATVPTISETILSSEKTIPTWGSFTLPCEDKFVPAVSAISEENHNENEISETSSVTSHMQDDPDVTPCLCNSTDSRALEAEVKKLEARLDAVGWLQEAIMQADLGMVANGCALPSPPGGQTFPASGQLPRSQWSDERPVQRPAEVGGTVLRWMPTEPRHTSQVRDSVAPPLHHHCTVPQRVPRHEPPSPQPRRHAEQSLERAAPSHQRGASCQERAAMFRERTAPSTSPVPPPGIRSLSPPVHVMPSVACHQDEAFLKKGLSASSGSATHDVHVDCQDTSGRSSQSSALMDRPVQQWSVNDVVNFMSSFCAIPPDLVDILWAQAISGPVLLSLSEADLEELRIEKFGHRRLLMLGAQELRCTAERQRQGQHEQRVQTPGHVLPIPTTQAQGFAHGQSTGAQLQRTVSLQQLRDTRGINQPDLRLHPIARAKSVPQLVPARGHSPGRAARARAATRFRQRMRQQGWTTWTPQCSDVSCNPGFNTAAFTAVNCVKVRSHLDVQPLDCEPVFLLILDVVIRFWMS
mmetsp:Transcript_11685/g.31448  ORF Transcript_11685/g.31448 Transcript_11685/m.31448 type:complete len:646 (+) Transcript_11685:153-2090(+)